MRWLAEEAARITAGRIVRGKPEKGASGISTDSRQLKPGEGFIALKGLRFDGHDFAFEAVKKGAAWVMVERNYDPSRLPEGAVVIAVADTLAALGALAAEYRRRFPVKVIAITGSIGKSTTKEMTAAVLSAKGRVLKNAGNLNNLIGLPLTLFKLTRAHDVAVLEMGCNQPGEIGRMVKIAAPEAGLITCVAPVHLEGLGSLSGVARAKTEMIRNLSGSSVFILNLDDHRIASHARGFPGKMIGFSAKTDKLFAGESVHLGGVEKEVIGGRPRISFSLQLCRGGRRVGKPVRCRLWTLARHNARNALAAATVGRAFGIPLEAAAERLAAVKGLAGRGEVIRSPAGFILINDTYNSNPAAAVEALENMAWWKGPGRGVAVLGEMLELGSYAEEYHREVGRAAAVTGMEVLLALGPHADVMVKAAVAAGLSRDSVLAARDHEEALQFLRRLLRPRDWVLIKGSRAMGMEKITAALAR